MGNVFPDHNDHKDKSFVRNVVRRAPVVIGDIIIAYLRIKLVQLPFARGLGVVVVHDFLAATTARGPNCHLPRDNSVLIVAGWLYSVGPETCFRMQVEPPTFTLEQLPPYAHTEPALLMRNNQLIAVSWKDPFEQIINRVWVDVFDLEHWQWSNKAVCDTPMQRRWWSACWTRVSDEEITAKIVAWCGVYALRIDAAWQPVFEPIPDNPGRGLSVKPPNQSSRMKTLALGQITADLNLGAWPNYRRFAEDVRLEHAWPLANDLVRNRSWRVCVDLHSSWPAMATANCLVAF